MLPSAFNRRIRGLSTLLKLREPATISFPFVWTRTLVISKSHVAQSKELSRLPSALSRAIWFFGTPLKIRVPPNEKVRILPSGWSSKLPSEPTLLAGIVLKKRQRCWFARRRLKQKQSAAKRWSCKAGFVSRGICDFSLLTPAISVWSNNRLKILCFSIETPLWNKFWEHCKTFPAGCKSNWIVSWNQSRNQIVDECW